VARIAGVVAVVAGVGCLLAAPTSSPIPWAPFSDAALDSARADGRPVLIDFEAAWCLPCREMERTTLRDPTVVRLASEFVTLKADVTGDDEHTTALMERFQIPGVPTYVLLGSDGRERRRLVGFIPADQMVAALREAAGGEAGDARG
jgi:thiol:disulfide interchange protein DsbD